MNIKRIVLVAVSMIATMSATAQSFEVKDFEDRPADLSLRVMA